MKNIISLIALLVSFTGFANANDDIQRLSPASVREAAEKAEAEAAAQKQAARIQAHVCKQIIDGAQSDFINMPPNDVYTNDYYSNGPRQMGDSSSYDQFDENIKKRQSGDVLKKRRTPGPQYE